MLPRALTLALLASSALARNATRAETDPFVLSIVDRAPLSETQRLASAYGDLNGPYAGSGYAVDPNATPIYHAVSHGNLPAYRWLRDQGVDLGPRTGRTLLHKAADMRLPKVVADLLARGFSPNAPGDGASNAPKDATPVRLASDVFGKDSDGSLATFFLLVDAGGKAAPADLARMLFVAAHRAAPVPTFVRGGDAAYRRRFLAQRAEGLAAVRRLLALGADVDEPVAFARGHVLSPRPVWEEAAAYGDLGLLRLVLPLSRRAKGAEPRLTETARRNRNERIVRELLRRGFPPPR